MQPLAVYAFYMWKVVLTYKCVCTAAASWIMTTNRGEAALILCQALCSQLLVCDLTSFPQPYEAVSLLFPFHMRKLRLSYFSRSWGFRGRSWGSCSSRPQSHALNQSLMPLLPLVSAEEPEVGVVFPRWRWITLKHLIVCQALPWSVVLVFLLSLGLGPGQTGCVGRWGQERGLLTGKRSQVAQPRRGAGGSPQLTRALW